MFCKRPCCNFKYMKKFILLFVTCFSFFANSQVELKPGVKAGLNLANISNADYKVKPDFYAGISLGLKFSERYTLQPELVYSRQGARSELDGASNSEIQIDYFSIGVANKYKLIQGVNLYAVAGPFLDVIIKDNIDYEPFLNLTGTFDIGLFAGLDYEFWSGLGVEFRYKFGLKEVNGIGNDVNVEHFNRVFQVGLSYNFKF